MSVKFSKEELGGTTNLEHSLSIVVLPRLVLKPDDGVITLLYCANGICYGGT